MRVSRNGTKVARFGLSLARERLLDWLEEIER
jgi:hypothetical protein